MYVYGLLWLKSNPNSISITDFKTINKDLDEFQNDQQYLRKFSSRIRHDYLDLQVFQMENIIETQNQKTRI